MERKTWGDIIFSGFYCNQPKETAVERIEEFMQEVQSNGEQCTCAYPNTSSCSPSKLNFDDLREVLSELKGLRQKVKENPND